MWYTVVIQETGIMVKRTYEIWQVSAQTLLAHAVPQNEGRYYTSNNSWPIRAAALE